MYGFGPNSPINGFDDLGGMWSVPGMPGLQWGNPFAPPKTNPFQVARDVADDLDEWIVKVVVCCENNLAKSGADSALLVTALTGAYMLQQCTQDVVDVARIGESVQEHGFSGVDDELIRLGTVAGGAGGKYLAKGATKLCKKACEVITVKISKINGRFPINSKYAGKTHPSGVKFTEEGFPDFGPYSKAHVELDGLTGNYAKDAAMANKHFGLNQTPDGYVWHHVEDGRTLQLVPQEIHNAVRHTGGAAIIRDYGID